MVYSPIQYKVHEKLKGKKAVIFAIPGTILKKQKKNHIY